MGNARHRLLIPEEMSWGETLRVIVRLVGWKFRRRLGRR